jgi:hypothetical protein
MLRNNAPGQENRAARPDFGWILIGKALESALRPAESGAVVRRTIRKQSTAGVATDITSTASIALIGPAPVF